MTPLLADFTELQGGDLVHALEQRFVTAITDVDIGSRALSMLHPRNSDDLISEEDFVRDERLPYWADIWPSSTILAREIVSRSGSGRGLELGCGVGLVTTAALVAGYDILATDYYTDALAFTRANAWRNIGRTPSARMVDWRHFPREMRGFDIVLASDVLYEREYAQILPPILKHSLAAQGIAIIADPGRIATPEFLDGCGAAGLTVRSHVTRPYASGDIRQKIDLYEIALSS